MHGRNASIEELLDWRPYDYSTLPNTVPTPIGPVRFLMTMELEPTSDGTVLHMRAAPPAKRRERVLMRLMSRMLDRGMQAANAPPVEELAAEFERQGGDPVEEPSVPRPRPGGLLAGLPAEP